MVIVELLECTPNAERLVETAYLQCQSQFGQIEEKRGEKTWDSRMSTIMNSGHFSVLEHPSITFSIRNISRACSHQIVRHRIGIAISQMSMRHVEVDNAVGDFVIPDRIKDIGVDSLYLKAIGFSVNLYKAVLEEAGPDADNIMEDIRMVLPIATKTQIVMTFSARALIHFLRLRLSKHAQWEIRAVAEQMYEHAKMWMPTTFDEKWKKCWE